MYGYRSKKSISLDLSDYFNNDDSNGDRLAEYLQKRRGGVQCQQFLFGESEPLRLSVDVQLENIPNAEQNKNNQTKEQAREAECPAEDMDLTAETRNEEEHQKAADDIAKVGEKTNLSNAQQNNRIFALRKSGGVSPSDRLRRYTLKRHTKLTNGRRTLLKEFESTLNSPDFLPTVCSTPFSQNLHSKNPTTPAHPTRNVDHTEANITQVNDTPNIPTKENNCSWSATHKQASEDMNESIQQMMESIVETTLKRVQSQNKENLIKNKTFQKDHDNTSIDDTTNKPKQNILMANVAVPQNSSAITGNVHKSCQRCPSYAARKSPDNGKTCIHITHQTLGSSRCSHNCKQVGKPNTGHLDREYSITYVGNEDRNLSNPKDLTDMDISSLQTHVDHNITLRSGKNSKTLHNSMSLNPLTTTNHAQVTVCFDTPQKMNLSKTKEKNLSLRGKKCVVMLRKIEKAVQKSNFEASANKTTTLSPGLREMGCSSTKIVFAGNAIDGTLYNEELIIPETQDIPLTVTQSRKQNLVVSPARQAIHNDECSPCRPANALNVSNKSICSRKAYTEKETDNLKLTDILTEDEDEPTYSKLSQANKSSSLDPLNLADNGRRSQRKRTSSRRRVEEEMTQDINNETQTEPISLSVNYRRRSFKQRKIPLNKAPGAALNGEKFAKELARMSNYEIIDLRKKNSVGKVFAVSGRKSTLDVAGMIYNEVKLNEEIEIELLRRGKSIAEAAVDNVDETQAELEKGSDTMELIRRSNGIGELELNNAEEEALVEILNEPDTIETEIIHRSNGLAEVAVNNMKEALSEIHNDIHIHTNVTDYLPAPNNFGDVVSTQSPSSPCSASSLIDQTQNERVSFCKKRVSLKVTKTSLVPVVLQNYLEVSKKFTKSNRQKRRPENITKRLLYTPGHSDSEETILNSSSEKRVMHYQADNSLPCVPSPPELMTDCITELRVVSPPPPFSMSLKTRQNKDAESTVETPPEIESLTQMPHLPPPPNFQSDMGVETSNMSQDQVNVGEQKNDDHIFKKPAVPLPAKKKRKIRPNLSTNESAVTDSSENDKTEQGSLRRSKRGHVPLTYESTLFQRMLKTVIDKRHKAIEQYNSKNKQKNREIGKRNTGNTLVKTNTTSSGNSTILQHQKLKPAVVVCSSTEQNSRLTKGRRKKIDEKRSNSVERKAKVGKGEDLSLNRLTLTAPPLDHLNNAFDQLRNPSEVDERNFEKNIHNSQAISSVKNLRVRVARLKEINKGKEKNVSFPSRPINATQLMTPENNSTVSTVTNDSKASNFELISWLKNRTEAENSSCDTIFKEMRISSASNLSFTELQGIEYAFYDTEEQASLGYLRFKPRQIKATKRAKRYELHFVALFGNFRITAQDKESLVGPGDMVAIKKSVYYNIENMSDDISILMVIKKMI